MGQAAAAGVGAGGYNLTLRHARESLSTDANGMLICMESTAAW